MSKSRYVGHFKRSSWVSKWKANIDPLSVMKVAGCSQTLWLLNINIFQFSPKIICIIDSADKTILSRYLGKSWLAASTVFCRTKKESGMGSLHTFKTYIYKFWLPFYINGIRGAMVARLTPDQKVACSIHVGFNSLQAIPILFEFLCIKLYKRDGDPLYIYFVYFSFPPINGREFLGIFLPTNYTRGVDILYFFSLLDRLT